MNETGVNERTTTTVAGGKPGQDAETGQAARGMAAARRPGGGPPWANMGMPAEKASNFGPSVRRLAVRLAPERIGVFAVLALGVVSVTLSVLGPRLLGAATDLIFAGVIGRQLPAGVSTDQAAAAARAAGSRSSRASRPGSRQGPAAPPHPVVRWRRPGAGASG